MNNLMLDALKCSNEQRPPVWFMRQAGRFLPEYRALRTRYSLMELFHDPKLIAEVTLQPVDILGVDAAILFSDILVILETFGISYDFEEGRGPMIQQPIQNEEDVGRLFYEDVKEKLSFITQGIHHTLPKLTVPLLGFCGAPFTVASYLIEGGTSKDFKKTKQWLYSHPASFHQLLDKLTRASIEYLKLQIEAGVSAVQLFDSWANLLNDREFKACSLIYLKRIIDALKPFNIPVILFCRSASLRAKELAETGASAISVDWNGNLAHIRKQIGGKVALQGNFDPAIFYGSEEYILSEAKYLLSAMKGDPGFIFNLGHGMLPDAPVEKVKHLVNFIKS